MRHAKLRSNFVENFLDLFRTAFADESEEERPRKSNLKKIKKPSTVEGLISTVVTNTQQLANAAKERTRSLASVAFGNSDGLANAAKEHTKSFVSRASKTSHALSENARKQRSVFRNRWGRFRRWFVAMVMRCCIGEDELQIVINRNHDDLNGPHPSSRLACFSDSTDSESSEAGELLKENQETNAQDRIRKKADPRGSASTDVRNAYFHNYKDSFVNTSKIKEKNGRNGGSEKIDAAESRFSLEVSNPDGLDLERSGSTSRSNESSSGQLYENSGYEPTSACGSGASTIRASIGDHTGSNGADDDPNCCVEEDSVVTPKGDISGRFEIRSFPDEEERVLVAPVPDPVALPHTRELHPPCSSYSPEKNCGLHSLQSHLENSSATDPVTTPYAFSVDSCSSFSRQSSRRTSVYSVVTKEPCEKTSVGLPNLGDGSRNSHESRLQK